MPMPTSRHRAQPTGHPRRAPRHAATIRRRRALRTFGVAMTALMLFGGVGTVAALQSLQDNIDQHDIGGLLGTERPTDEGAEAPPDSLADRPVNILLMGSDARDGENARYGQVEGMRSDTTLLVHIPADRSRVEVVSIPRDLIVEIPACTLPDGSSTPAHGLGTDEHDGARFNAAFAYGGISGDVGAAAACTIRTVEAMSQIYIDDFVVVDFTGFEHMVDAIGGVEMCFEQDMIDPLAQLDVAAGCHSLTGEEALGIARARKGLAGADGSDIGRIDRQQELLGAMAEQVLSAQVIADPARLLPFLSAATASVSASERLGHLPTLTGLAYSLRDLGTSDVTFATVPFDWSGNVVLQNEDTEALWESLRQDRPMDLPEPDEDAAGVAADASVGSRGTAVGATMPR